jgi:hypothetical protein
MPYTTVINPLNSALKRLQAFRETTWGTKGPATLAWMGVDPNPTIKPYFKPNRFIDQRGSLQESFYSAIAKKGGDFNMKGFATYEDLIYLLESGLQGGVAATGGPAYVWTFAAPKSAVWAPQAYTFEYGYDFGAVFSMGSIINKWKISGEAEKWWTWDASGFFQSLFFPTQTNIASSTNASPVEITTSGNHGLATGDTVVISGHLTNTGANGTWVIIYVSPTKYTCTASVGNGVGGATGTATKTLTGSIADRTVESILMGTTVLAMDPMGTAPGTTTFPGTLLKFELDVDSGVKPDYTAGQLYPTVITFERMKVTMTLDLLYNSYVQTLVQNQLFLNTGVNVQLKSTSGTHVAEIDFCGVLSDDISFYPDKNGAQYITLKLASMYDTASMTNSLKVIISNGIAALV